MLLSWWIGVWSISDSRNNACTTASSLTLLSGISTKRLGHSKPHADLTELKLQFLVICDASSSQSQSSRCSIKEQNCLNVFK